MLTNKDITRLLDGRCVAHKNTLKNVNNKLILFCLRNGWIFDLQIGTFFSINMTKTFVRDCWVMYLNVLLNLIQNPTFNDIYGWLGSVANSHGLSTTPSSTKIDIFWINGNKWLAKWRGTSIVAVCLELAPFL